MATGCIIYIKALVTIIIERFYMVLSSSEVPADIKRVIRLSGAKSNCIPLRQRNKFHDIIYLLLLEVFTKKIPYKMHHGHRADISNSSEKEIFIICINSISKYF